MTNGRVVIDESALTGEPLPKSKNAGDGLFNGTVNVGDAFEMIADKIGEDSRIFENSSTRQKGSGGESANSTPC